MQIQKKKINLQEINGILLLDKPIDCSSNFILQRVKHLFQAKKAGHTGSLDPLATGMLPICFGEATKFSEFLLSSDKCYEVTAQLGITTTTGDSQGDIVTQHDSFNVTKEQISTVIPSFIGSIDQVPPMFSALKYNGQPLYKYARSGIEISRKSRQVNIYSIQLLDFNVNSFKLRVICSKGTYIRTLIEDIGEKLGIGAHVIQLRRLYTAGFENAEMFPFSRLQTMSELERETILLPVDLAVQHLPKLDIEKEHVVDLYHGKLVENLELSSYSNTILRLYNLADQRFIGLGKVVDGKILQAKRLLNRLGN